MDKNLTGPGTPLAVHPQLQSTMPLHPKAVQWEDGVEGTKADAEAGVEAIAEENWGYCSVRQPVFDTPHERLSLLLRHPSNFWTCWALQTEVLCLQL